MQFLRNILGPQDNIDNLVAKKNVRGLIRALEHDDRMVRKRAIVALGEIGDKRAVKPLITIHSRLFDAGWDICQAAAEALGRIGDARAIEALISTMRSNARDDVRDTCAEALGNIGAPAAESITNLHLDVSMQRFPDKKKLDRTGRTMTRIGEPAVEALLVRLKTCKGSGAGAHQLRKAIEAALTQIGDVAVAPVEAFLQTEQGLSVSYARNALRGIANASKTKPVLPPFTIEGAVWFVSEYNPRGHWQKHKPQLVIEGVPEGEKVTPELLVKAGYDYLDPARPREDDIRISISRLHPATIEHILDDGRERSLHDTDKSIKRILLHKGYDYTTWKKLLDKAGLAPPEVE